MLVGLDVILGLLVAVAALALLARKISIPYPILLVIGGLLLALTPGVPEIKLDPQIIFVLFLPPLLYPAALFTSWRDFRSNLRAIILLAVGLVVFTTCAVGWFAHSIVAELPLAAAFILGAIVSPPDAVAATAVMERLSVPRRIVAIIEGESLVNDATALVAYSFAIEALNGGSFSLGRASVQFVIVCVGGIGFGLLIGWVASHVQRRLDDPPVQITISLLTPFAAYLPASQMGVSGVLAVVTAGLYLGWRSPLIINSRMRLQAGPVWEMVEFVLNGLVFILIGLQLKDVVHDLLTTRSAPRLCWEAALICALVILVRFLWVFVATYVPRWLSKKLCEKDPPPNWRMVVIVSWTGMRGVVSLAAAMALPSRLSDQTQCNIIIFFTFVVILVTLVLQGLTLPYLIRSLNVRDSGQTDKEERHARLKANQAALARLGELEINGNYGKHLLQRLRVEYDDRVRQLEACEPAADGHHHLLSADYEELQKETLLVERQTILQLRNERFISDHAFRRIQRDIDLAEARMRERD